MTKGMPDREQSVSVTSDRIFEEPCEATSLTHGFEAERRGRPLRLGTYLHRDPALQQAGVRLPRSQTTIWKILRQAGCIAQDRRRKPKPLELRQPGEEVQFDLKDASSVPADPKGSDSMWSRLPTSSMQAPRSGCTARCAAMRDAEALLEVVAQFFCQHGLPACSPLTMIPVLLVALPGSCGVDKARSALRISAVSAHPSQADSRSPVGLSLPSVQPQGITHPHHWQTVRDGASPCLACAGVFSRAQRRACHQKKHSARFTL